MTWQQILSIVDEHLGVDATRRGIEIFRQRHARNAVIDLQRYITAYQKGHAIVLTQEDLIEQGCAQQGQLPVGAQPRAFYIYEVDEETPATAQLGDLITSWTQLLSKPTLGVDVPQMVFWYNQGNGQLMATQLVAGTQPTDIENGYARPYDYQNVINERYWRRVNVGTSIPALLPPNTEQPWNQLTQPWDSYTDPWDSYV